MGVNAPPRETGGRSALPVRMGLLGATAALALLGAASSTAAGPTVEAAAAGGGYVWTPSTVATTPGGAVDFKNPSAVVEHGVTWKGGPETPSCTGVPIDDFKAGWSGSCTFAQAGTYTFVCTVHPTEMKGSVTVGSGASEPPGPGPSPGSSGPVATGLKLARSQRGSIVRGSIELGGSGGRLEVRLLAARRALSGRGAGKVSAGRLVRPSAPAGRVPISVPLRPPARRALRNEKRLSLSARVVVVGPAGESFERTLGVVLRSGKSSTGGSG